MVGFVEGFHCTICYFYISLTSHHFPLCPFIVAYLSNPGAVIEHFKLEQNLREFVVVLDDFLRIGSLQNVVMLLESLHWLKDTSIQLACPRNLACKGDVVIVSALCVQENVIC